MTRAASSVLTSWLCIALAGLGACDEQPLSRLQDTKADLFGLEARLASDPSACVDYLALCERAASLCLMVDRTPDSEVVCDDITGRCQTNLDKYCQEVVADGGPPAAGDGAPPLAPDSVGPPPSCGDGTCEGGESCSICPADCEACPTQTSTLDPVADGYVDQGAGASNFGSATTLRTDQGPDQQALLRFVVPALSGAVQSAKLRLYVVNGSSDGPALHLTAGTWSESSVTWNNHPQLAGSAIVDLGSVPTGWLEIDLSSVVKGQGELSLTLVPTSSDGTDFASRESANPPQLVLTAGGPGPGAAPPAPDASAEASAADAGAVAPPTPPAADAGTPGNVSLDNQYEGYPKWCKVTVHTHPAKTSGSTLASAYEAAGYDLVFFTDHDYDTQTPPVTNAGLLVVKGEEVSTAAGHCNALGISSFIQADLSRQATIDAAATQGGLVQVNHPSRYGVTKAELDGLTGLWGLEVKNESQNDPRDVVLWDSQISQGKKLWGTFSDDAHSTSAVGRGWLMVNTPADCSQAAVMASMKAGSFYNSEGPQLTITVSGSTISVASPTATKLEWFKQDMTKIRTSAASSDSYTIDGSEVFVRIVATSSDGKLAMSQPIFAKP